MLSPNTRYRLTGRGVDTIVHVVSVNHEVIKFVDSELGYFEREPDKLFHHWKANGFRLEKLQEGPDV